MRRRNLIAAAAFAVATTAGVGVSPAGAQAAPPAPCAPGDLACELVRGLEEVLAPTVAPPPPGPPSSTTPGTSPATTAGSAGLAPGEVQASGAAGTPAELSAEPGRVPSVPVGQALELPPLTIPDFGAPDGAEPSPVANVVRPLRSQVGDALTGVARPAPQRGADTALAAAVAVGVPALLVGFSLLARRRVAARRPLEVADPA